VKIQNIKRGDPGFQAPRGPELSGERGDGQLHFHRTLTGMSQDKYIARLQELKADIDEQGRRLSDKVDIKEVERFRKLIRDFLDEIVSNGYTFSREDAYATRGRHRFIATVQIIDKKLDELGKEVLSENADKIDIMSKIDDIRGLLLDLMT